jgi:ubiquinone/menaquinone biosynthesis C-methylase UbiE
MEERGLLDRLHYTGLDPSQCMLDLAQRKVTHPNVEWVHSPVEGYEPDEKFDRVVLRAILAHHDDPLPILRSTIGLVKPGGMLYIIFWNNPVSGPTIRSMTSWEVPDNAHPREDLIACLEEAKVQLVSEDWVKEPSAREVHRVVWRIQC